jgi:2-haloalkanoic acid dehalogenase type II
MDLPNELEVLTFDCYGTLVDWLGGVRAALAELPGLAGCDLERVVRDRDELDREEVLAPYAPYGEKLGRTLRGAALRQGRELGDDEVRRFVESMPSWPPFPDAAPSLRRLRARHRLLVLSNVETRVLEATLARLGAPVEGFVTAEQVRSYKPARAHWDEALRRTKAPRERVMHVAQSLFHDVRPALELGWRVAWVDRQDEPLPSGVRPQLVVKDLRELADRLA